MYPSGEIQFLGRWRLAAYPVYIHRAVAGNTVLTRDMFIQDLVLLRHRGAAQIRFGGGTAAGGEDGWG